MLVQQIIVSDNAHATRILRRLAQLTITARVAPRWQGPALPPPLVGDPVARFLLATYGMPGEAR